MTTSADVADWTMGLDDVVDRIAARFGRSEPRRWATAYLRGLLSPIERKNGWQLAEAVGDRTPDGVQEFFSRTVWDVDAVQDDLQAYVVEQSGDPGAVLILDETGFLKKGTKSAGFARQYPGTAGQVENSQIDVFLGYASRHGRMLLDRALYLPKDWAKDKVRRAEAHIPDDTSFATKPMLGLARLERTLAAGVPFAWITGDSVYGGVYALRQWAEQHRRGCVLTVACDQHLGLRPVAAWIEGLGEASWQSLSPGDGAKEPRLYDWAYLPHGGGAKSFRCGLLVRRSIADPSDVTFYLNSCARGDNARHFGEDRRIAVFHRESVRRGQRRGRPRLVRSPFLDGVASPHHLRPAGPRLPRRCPKGRYRGVWTRNTS